MHFRSTFGAAGDLEERGKQCYTLFGLAHILFAERGSIVREPRVAQPVVLVEVNLNPERTRNK